MVTGRAPVAPSILLADDHPLVRFSVREELEESGFRVCAEVGTAEDAVEAALRERPDLCLLDLSMPGSGLAAAREIGRRLPSTKVVMLTASALEEHFVEAVRAGAAGYLLKDDDPSRLPHALRDVLAGVPAFPRRLLPPLVAAARRDLAAVSAAE